MGPSDEPGIGPVVWGSDGTQHQVISQKESWAEVHGSYQWPHLTMDGNPVFRWASFEMAKAAQQALDVAGVKAEDLDLFIPHQANMRITDAMRRTLKLPEHVKVARDIERQGNTSAASIPLGDRRDARGRRGQERRPRPDHRLRRGPGVRRPGDPPP